MDGEKRGNHRRGARAVVPLPGCGVVVIRNRAISFANAAFENLFAKGQDLFGREWPPPPASEQPRTLREITLAGALALLERRAGGSAVQHRYRAVADERRVDVLFNRIDPDLDARAPGGAPRRDLVVVVLHDVTAQVRSDAALNAAEAALAHQERVHAIGELAAGIVHDISNTLGAIRLRLSVLVRDPTCMAAQGSNIAALERIVKEGTEMLQKLQRLGHSDDDKAPEPLDLTEIVASAIEVAQSGLRHRAMNEGIDIRIENTVPHLPKVTAWRDDLLRIFVNLLINARDAMPLGGCVRVTGEQRGTRIAVRVQDEGTGIPAAVMPRIFDSYFTTKGRGGTGMGLATVRRAMERLGGSVSVSNHARGGAVFTLSFPLRSRLNAAGSGAGRTDRVEPADADHLLNPPD